MRRLIWLPLAGALLTGGAAVAVAAPHVVADAAVTASQLPVRGAALLEQVLADLVEQQVITQQQADAITGALEERVEQERAEFEARREELREMVEQLRGFLEDDVLTADEVAQLPEGRIRSALEGLLQDGEITREQLRELRLLFAPGLHDGHGRHYGHGRPFGPGFAPGAPWRDWRTDQPAESDDVDGTDAAPTDAASGVQES